MKVSSLKRTRTRYIAHKPSKIAAYGVLFAHSSVEFDRLGLSDPDSSRAIGRREPFGNHSGWEGSVILVRAFDRSQEHIMSRAPLVLSAGRILRSSFFALADGEAPLLALWPKAIASRCKNPPLYSRNMSIA